eukprot:Sdes_comp16198_c0_seq1m5456
MIPSLCVLDHQSVECSNQGTMMASAFHQLKCFEQNDKNEISMTEVEYFQNSLQEKLYSPGELPSFSVQFQQDANQTRGKQNNSYASSVLSHWIYSCCKKYELNFSIFPSFFF